MVLRSLVARLDTRRLLALSRRLAPGREFIVSGQERLTRREVFARVDALAAGLQSLGVEPGDRVATLLPACAESICAFFLPWELGNVEVPLNPLLGEHDLRHILRHCGARAVITTKRWMGSDFPALLERVRPDLPALEHVVVRDLDDSTTPGTESLASVMSSGARLRRVRRPASEIGRICYTSGTTGMPKGVTHALGGYWALTRMGLEERARGAHIDCFLQAFPPYHVAGVMPVIAGLLQGGRVVLVERFDPRHVLETIERERVAQVAGSPTMLKMLLRTPEIANYDLSSLQRVTVGSEPCPLEVAREAHERFRCQLINSYGTTEAGVISWTDIGDSWERVATTVGKAVPGGTVRIVDDRRQPVPAGVQGEVVAQTPQMMMGYYRNQELTAQVLDSDGWFYTGDIGVKDEDGTLRLVDRKKDLIIRGGENVCPAEVEHYLERHPAIRRAAVIGVPSDVAGELVWAYVMPAPGTELTAKDVLDFCRGQIAPFKIPARVRFLRDLPTTATGKVKKFRLRELAAQERSNRPGRTGEVGGDG